MEDSDDARAKGLCRKPEFEYMEVSIYAQNWDSAIYQAWILQILLSEMLDVPTVVDTWKAGQLKTNFYNPSNKLDYEEGSSFNGLQEARRVIDCRKAKADPNNYTFYSHMEQEYWPGSHRFTRMRGVIEDRVIGNPEAGGLIGIGGWFVPEFTTKRDPSLTHYFAYQGKEIRQKIASRFLPPVAWKDYCETFSKDNCITDDGVASCPPQKENELDRYFFDGSYIGHFDHKSEKNNCTNILKIVLDILLIIHVNVGGQAMPVLSYIITRSLASGNTFDGEFPII